MSLKVKYFTLCFKNSSFLKVETAFCSIYYAFHMWVPNSWSVFALYKLRESCSVSKCEWQSRITDIFSNFTFYTFIPCTMWKRIQKYISSGNVSVFVHATKSNPLWYTSSLCQVKTILTKISPIWYPLNIELFIICLQSQLPKSWPLCLEPWRTIQCCGLALRHP